MLLCNLWIYTAAAAEIPDVGSCLSLFLFLCFIVILYLFLCVCSPPGYCKMLNFEWFNKKKNKKNMRPIRALLQTLKRRELGSRQRHSLTQAAHGIARALPKTSDFKEKAVEPVQIQYNII